jgi:hypothetical protein
MYTSDVVNILTFWPQNVLFNQIFIDLFPIPYLIFLNYIDLFVLCMK